MISWCLEKKLFFSRSVKKYINIFSLKSYRHFNFKSKFFVIFHDKILRGSNDWYLERGRIQLGEAMLCLFIYFFCERFHLYTILFFVVFLLQSSIPSEVILFVLTIINISVYKIIFRIEIFHLTRIIYWNIMRIIIWIREECSVLIYIKSVKHNYKYAP